MPELPEVEHTRRNLVRWMQNARVAKAIVYDVRIVRPLKPITVTRALIHKTIEAIDRRGKWLRIVFDDGSRIFAHLGMTGWFWSAKTATPLRFERVRFNLIHKGKPSSRVVFTDTRRWGRLILRRASEEDISAWTELGPDPLADGINLDDLATKLARRKQSSIKVALMDQSVLAGIGNIHAIEALWKAEVDPRSMAASLDTTRLQAIIDGLRWTIERAIQELHEVSPETDDSRGMGSYSDNPFTIYGRRDEPCPRCKAPLKWLMLGGRGTTFCANCQLRYGRKRKSAAKKKTKNKSKKKKKKKRTSKK